MPLRFVVALAALVGIATAVLAETPSGSGTGFFVNSGGWLVTNRHVVEGCSELEVKGYGAGQRLIKHPDYDLAIMRVSGGSDIKPVKLREAPPRLGEEVVTLGYPLSGILSDTIKITTGNINSLEGLQNDPLYLQVSAPIQPGNSGGPLIDRTGAVIGVNSATLAKKLSDAIDYNIQNVNFSMRLDVLRDFLNDEGIAFEKADSDTPEISTAEIAEAVEPSTVQILCYGQSSSTPQSPLANDEQQTPALASGGELRDAFGYDAIGFDYDTVRDVSYAQCKSQCGSDRSCQAITYNTRYNVCFLKEKALLLVRNSDAVSAYNTSQAADLLITDFSVYANKDAPGGDYARLRDADFVGCTAACLMDDQCSAFAYVRKTKDCWLKNRIGSVRDMSGVEFGIK